MSEGVSGCPVVCGRHLNSTCLSFSPTCGGPVANSGAGRTMGWTASLPGAPDCIFLAYLCVTTAPAPDSKEPPRAGRLRIQDGGARAAVAYAALRLAADSLPVRRSA